MKKILLTIYYSLFTIYCFSQVAPTPNSAGSGNCLEFNGVDEWVQDIGTLSSYSFVQNTVVFTIEAWIQMRSYPCCAFSLNTILSNTPTTGEKGFDFRFMDNIWGMNQFLNIQIYRGVGGQVVLAANSPENIITDTDWHYVSVVGNGTTVTFYVDGIPFLASDTPGFTANDQSVNTLSAGNSSRLLRIGDDYNSSPPFNSTPASPNGTLDEVRIWDTARTQAEIRDNMCQQLIGNEIGLVGYWPMDFMGSACGGATQVCDLTGNGNNGTLN